VAEPSSITEWRRRYESTAKETAPQGGWPLGSQQNPFRAPGGSAGAYFQGSRAGQFGFPKAAPLPENINDLRGVVERYKNQPTPWQQQFDVDNPGFINKWQGVFNLPQRGEDPNAPFNPNVGPQVAAMSDGGGLAGWAPAQAETEPALWDWRV